MIELLRKSAYKREPWKNGGGVTDLVATGKGDPPEWRVSVARIDADGPFSDFAGYDRTIVPLSGDGVELSFASGTLATLTRLYKPFAFAGEERVMCRLLGRGATDLNVMTLRKAYQHSVRIDVIEGLDLRPLVSEDHDASGEAVRLCYFIIGAGSIAGGPPMRSDVRVRAGDTVRIDTGSSASIHPEGRMMFSVVTLRPARASALEPTAPKKRHEGSRRSKA